MSSNHYVVATAKSWNVARYHSTISRLPGVWHLIEQPGDLTREKLDEINPRYIFFPHWSHKVPDEIVSRYECVCFHATDVPYGRGGSPVQNLIARGHQETVVSALRMVTELDAGPVYSKQPLSLLGGGEEVFLRLATVVAEMIAEIVASEPTPEPQTGEPTVFKRRTPEDSRIPQDMTALESLFDHIRMLDAEGYPPAFLDYGGLRIEFTRPALRTGRIEATVTIIPHPAEGNSE